RGDFGSGRAGSTNHPNLQENDTLRRHRAAELAVVSWIKRGAAMLTPKQARSTDLVLLVLIGLDVIYDIIIFCAPEKWAEWIHGVPLSDPHGLLRRLGAVWATFALFHLITLLRWRKNPNWLALSAGIRFTEIFADVTYVYFAQSLTFFGKTVLLLA